MRRFACLLLVLITTAQAQTPLTQWPHLNPAANHVMGIGTERAYPLLRQQGRPSVRPVLPGVGDHPTDLRERRYGNPDVATNPNPHEHGTEHGAGIIGADRANDLGMRGVADHVRILSVRAIPAGDGRDKDVANAVCYAVDHGASIISMSFDKYFSSEKAAGNEAMRYADGNVAELPATEPVRSALGQVWPRSKP